MEEILQFVRDNPGGWGLFLVYAAAGLEYLVPPLPADSVVLAGSLLVVAGVQPAWLVFACAVAGGFTGASIHFALGRWLVREDGSVRGRRWVDRMLGEGSLERFFEKLRRYGLWVIAFNRALPGVRAGTFFAAGAASMRFVPVMLAGLVSNVLWTALILGIGISVGDNWEEIERLFGVYKRGLYVVGGVATCLWLLHRYRKKKNASSNTD